MTLTQSGTTIASSPSDANGNYRFGGLSNGTYTITPTKTGFTPVASGVGTLVSLSGTASKSVTADSAGNYTFTGLSNGNYTVTPSKSGFTFSPTSQSVPVNGANMPGVNFTATVPTWTISGTGPPLKVSWVY